MKMAYIYLAMVLYVIGSIICGLGVLTLIIGIYANEV